MVSEKFVQDAFTNGKRIQFVLHDKKIGLSNWEFCDTNGDPRDVVNQGYSFSAGGIGGRVDIIATFNNRKNILLCEAKRGKVGDAELHQLLWYLENWNHDRSVMTDDTIKKTNQVIGILLGEDFFPIEKSLLEEVRKQRVYFVKFEFNDRSFPFTVVKPEELVTHENLSEDAKTLLKYSKLWLEEDWIQGCEPDLVSEYRKWSNCLMDESDARCKWVTKIFKGRHIAIHYKGEYIIWLYPKPDAKWLDGAYGYQGTHQNITLEHNSEVAKSEVNKILDRIDDKYAGMIPHGFDWEIKS